MLVAKTLARLSGRNKLTMQKKISDVLFEAEIQATANQENGQFGLTDLLYNQQYRQIHHDITVYKNPQGIMGLGGKN